MYFLYLRILQNFSMTQLHVLIVGASIAGPTAAYWFSKAGCKVTVIERFPQLRTNGQNVDIRTVGVTVMRKMPGVEEAVRDKLVPMHGISLVRDDGRPYGTISPTGNPDQQSLVSEYEIFRGDLARILVNLTKDDEKVTYIYGEQVKAMQQQGDGPVNVTFANGSPPALFDIVVACDGANSRTRALGLGCGVRDFMEPTYCWFAWFTVAHDIVRGSKVAQGFSAVGGRFIGVISDPSGVNRASCMTVERAGDNDAMRSFREAAEAGADALKEFVAARYSGGGWRYDEIMKAMMSSDDFYATEVAQVKVSSLYKGRFVMVGDAGYAGAPGSGTSLAMAGAYVLAGEVSERKADLAGALRAYDEKMRPLINDLQKSPRPLLTFLAPQAAWGIRFRNAVFALICWTGVLQLLQRFFSGAFADSQKYRLPEYTWTGDE